MKQVIVAIGCAVLLWTGKALSQTVEQRCDDARAAAWMRYGRCLDRAARRIDRRALRSLGVSGHGAAKCRHRYFRNWTRFQDATSLAGSSCVGTRFVDNGDGTVTDGLTTLVWEKKTETAGQHDVNSRYSWSTGAPWAEDGTAFTDFLATLNAGAFAGASDWRLPTLAELESIVQDYACRRQCNCGSDPCIDATLGPTDDQFYWSDTSNARVSDEAWIAHFVLGGIYFYSKTTTFSARAVRGGL